MSLWDKKRDVECQVELLNVQLIHERNTVFASAIMALGAAFGIFGVTTIVNILSNPTYSLSEIPSIVTFYIYLYTIGGTVFLGLGLFLLKKLGTTSDEKIEKIKKKYSDW